MLLAERQYGKRSFPRPQPGNEMLGDQRGIAKKKRPVAATPANLGRLFE